MEMKHKVFLVDDSGVIRSFFRNALEHYDIDVITFANPLEAIPEIPKQKPDCIMSDYEMPEMNGRDFCKQIKSIPEYRDIPFIMLSTHDEDKYILECINAGADDYLPKKTNPEIILSKIKLMLEIRSYRKALIANERMETYNATIATLKHEINNVSAIILPTIDRLNQLPTESFNDDDKSRLDRLQRNLKRLTEVIASLQEMKDAISFEPYRSDMKAKLVELKKV